MNGRVACVFFDLDNTLIDVSALTVDAYRTAIRDVARRDVPEEEILEAEPSGPAEEVISEILTRVGLVPDGQSVARIRTRMRAVQLDAEHAQRLLCPVDGCKELLAELKARGALGGVVTTKPENIARAHLEIAGLAGVFDLLIGKLPPGRNKPSPEGLLSALGRLNEARAEAGLEPLTPDDCAYVGDSPSDVLASRAAGMKSVAACWCLWGDSADGGAPELRERQREALEAVEPAVTLETPAQVLGLLDG